LGSLGCCSPNDDFARLYVLKCGAVFNVIGFLLMLISSLSLTENFAILARFNSYASATLTPDDDSFMKPAYIHLGLRAAAFDNPSTFGQRLVPYDRFCDLVNNGGGLDNYMSSDKCDQCSQVSFQLLLGVLIATVSFVPTIWIDLLRAYSNFDVNCQKVLSTVLSLISIAGCIFTYHQFTNECLNSFFDNNISYDTSGSVISDGSSKERAVTVNFEWDWGAGATLLFAALGLKFIQFVCNCCIPTPRITRDLGDQEDYEKLAEESDDEDLW
jgi:hypothetical protein